MRKNGISSFIIRGYRFHFPLCLRSATRRKKGRLCIRARIELRLRSTRARDGGGGTAKQRPLRIAREEGRERERERGGKPSVEHGLDGFTHRPLKYYTGARKRRDATAKKEGT